MKTSFKLLSILLAAGFAGAVFAEILGARLPSSFNLANLTGVFCAGLIGFLFVADYSRQPRLHRAMTPAKVLAASGSTETHRLAA